MAEKTKKSYIIQFVIVAILLAGGYFFFTQARQAKHVNYITYFNNIQGLQPSSPVQINGVRVGKISDILLEGDRLKVMIAIDKDIALPEGTRAALASGGGTGEKIISLNLGKGNNILPENAILVSSLDSSVLPMSARVTPMIESAKMILQSADVGLTGMTYLIKGGLATQSMDMLIKAEQQAVKLEHMTEELDRSTAKLRQPIHKAESKVADMAAHTRETTQSIHQLENTTAKAAQTPYAANLDTLRNNIRNIGNTFRQLKNSTAIAEKNTYEKASQSAGKTNEGMKDLIERAK